MRGASIFIVLFILVASQRSNAGVREGLSDEKDNAAPIHIQSDKLQVKDKDRHAIWRGNVVAKKGTVTLYSDELHAHYNEDGEIERLVATKHVKIIKKKAEATADKATFFQNDQSLVLTGRPVLIREGNTLKGKRVIVYLDDDRIEIERARVNFRLAGKKKSKNKKQKKNQKNKKRHDGATKAK